ncbi:MAG TPA: Dabb family protein [Solirubrobacteraceae bacterium]|nr:Dabb family protein [Solirubrobacteraceae bacterium]
MNKWRPDAPREAVEGAITALAELPDKISTIRGLQLCESIGPEGDDFDFVLIIDFDDEQAFDDYIQNPAHLAVVRGLIQPIIESTARIRCEVPSSG